MSLAANRWMLCESCRVGFQALDSCCPRCGTSLRANVASPDELALFKSAEQLQRGRQSDMPVRGKRAKQRSARLQTLQLRWAVGFFLFSLLAASAQVGKSMYDKAKQDSQPQAKHSGKSGQSGLSVEAKQKLMPAVVQNFAGFMQSNNALDKARFVSDAHRWVGEMQRYYQGKLAESFQSAPKLLDMQLLPQGKDARKRLATLWQLQDGSTLEVCQLADADGNWLIDWPYFVRYNPVSWSDFLQGNAASQGVFRLSLKLRQPYVKGDKFIKLALYEANGYMGNRLHGRVSNDVELSVSEAASCGLLALLEAQPESTLLGQHDVEKSRRLLVLLQRLDTGYGNYKLKLCKVLANDWFANDGELEAAKTQF